MAKYVKGQVSPRKGIKMSEGIKKKISEAKRGCKGPNLGKKFSEEHRVNISKGKKGIKQTLLARAARSKPRKLNDGDILLTQLSMRIRKLFKSRLWRSDVFTRDDFTCQICNKRGGDMEAHHKKKFSQIIRDNNIKTVEEANICEELWNINNGITLCLDCHKKEHTKNMTITIEQ